MRTAILYSEKGDDPAFEIVEPGYATESELRLVHTEEYIRRVERCESREPHCGLAGTEVDLDEPCAIPQGYKSDYAVPETKKIVETVKTKLASYWNCFA